MLGLVLSYYVCGCIGIEILVCYCIRLITYTLLYSFIYIGVRTYITLFSLLLDWCYNLLLHIRFVIVLVLELILPYVYVLSLCL